MANVLLVEDADEVRDLLCEAIEAAGHQAHCVATCKDAEAALVSGVYSVMISNVRLPDGSGRELAENARNRGVPVVLITGHPDELQVLALQDHIRVLPKPFRLHDLTAAIDAQLGA